MKKYFVFIIFLVCNILISRAQLGGSHVYKFLNLPPTARISALGGKLFSVRDKDPAMAMLNPSMLQSAMSNSISFDITDYFSNAVYGHVNYIRHFNKIGTFDFATSFVSYGSFDGYDIYGNSTGTFSAGDVVLMASYGREFVDSIFSMGMNTKLIFSKYEQYFSLGLAVDFAASYYNAKHDLSLTLLLSNIGTQIVTYSGTREKIPFEIQLGFSQRFKHLPVRYSITLQHLQKWDLTYSDPADPFAQIDVMTGEVAPASKAAQFADKLFRHFIFGLEILPMKYFSLQVSYNYNTLRQMRTYQKRGVIGLAYGVGLHIYHFNFYYARSHSNLGSVPNQFTISTNISEFIKK
ncbi:MAG: type IX secretion system protein PorQ [Bacteroidales bacterium]|jgi:hypothetical protein|nr:type IX secretion system protein PorQ [Bacteroidales bacterium]